MSWHQINPSSRSTRVNRHQISPSSRSTRVSWHQISPSSRSIRVSRHQISPSSRSTRVSWHQIVLPPRQPRWAGIRSVEYIHHPLSPVLSSLWDCLPLISFLHFLWSGASDACKCKHFKSLSTTSFQVLPLSRVPSYLIIMNDWFIANKRLISWRFTEFVVT